MKVLKPYILLVEKMYLSTENWKKRIKVGESA